MLIKVSPKTLSKRTCRKLLREASVRWFSTDKSSYITDADIPVSDGNSQKVTLTRLDKEKANSHASTQSHYL